MTHYVPPRNADALASPALLIDEALVRQNIDQALALAGGPARLRPHVKTNKTRAVTDLLLARGVRQFKCATTTEAEMLAQQAASDVLLAYPAVGPTARRFVELVAQYPTTLFSCLVDNVMAADALNELATRLLPEQRSVRVYLDLNVGMNRTGTQPANVVALYAHCRALPRLHVVGLHAYDGHVRDPNPIDRQRSAGVTYERAADARRRIGAHDGTELPLIMGGSPTFAFHAQRPDVAEVSPGTFVFWDAGYAQLLPDLPFTPAAVLLTRVVSVLDATTVCLDLGHKAVAAEMPQPRIRFLNGVDAEPIGQSEEHLVVRVPNASRFSPGDAWYAVPVHICPTVALHETLYVVKNGRWTDTWPVVARGRSHPAPNVVATT